MSPKSDPTPGSISAEHIVESITVPVILLTPEGWVIHSNKESRRLFELVSGVSSVLDLFCVSQNPNSFYTLQQLLLRACSSSTALPCRLKYKQDNSEHRAVLTSIRANSNSPLPNALMLQFDTRMQGLSGKINLLNRDLKAKNQLLTKLRAEGIKDPLTTLYNRRYVESVIEMECNLSARTPLRACCALIDLDHFKLINDRFGHDAGDKVLIAVSDLLTHCKRDSDVLGRWGGEEFLMFFHDANIEQAAKVCDRLLEQIRALRFDFDSTYTCTASIGISQLQQQDTTLTLVKRADIALYKAKESGRDQLFINDRE